MLLKLQLFKRTRQTRRFKQGLDMALNVKGLIDVR